jgi:hypothetical protein
MLVWVMLGVNDATPDSCEYQEVLAVFDHDPTQDEQEEIASLHQALSHFQDRFDSYEVEEHRVLTKEKE